MFDLLLASVIHFLIVQHTAYLLVFHGSSDPRAQAAAATLAEQFAEKISYIQTLRMSQQIDNSNIDFKSPMPWVEVAPLEGDAPLHQRIQQIGFKLHQLGNGLSQAQVLLLPLFLLQGVHTMEDIPAEVALSQQALGQSVLIKTTPPLGSHVGLFRLLTERMAAFPVEAWVLLSHGSRRVPAKLDIEALAHRLGTVTAYWSIAPDLETRLQELTAQGLTRIGILPYFLFRGKTTDAIAQRVAQLSQQHPALNLHLSAPLEASAELADLLIGLATTGLDQDHPFGSSFG